MIDKGDGEEILVHQPALYFSGGADSITLVQYWDGGERHFICVASGNVPTLIGQLQKFYDNFANGIEGTRLTKRRKRA